MGVGRIEPHGRIRFGGGLVVTTLLGEVQRQLAARQQSSGCSVTSSRTAGSAATAPSSRCHDTSNCRNG
jgi:hypothetical protein